MCKDDRITNSLFTDLFALAGGPMLLDAIDEDDDESLSSEDDDEALAQLNDQAAFDDMDEEDDDLLLGPGAGEGPGQEANPCAIM